MNQHASHPETWLVVADGEHAVIYTRVREERPVPPRDQSTPSSPWKLNRLHQLKAEPQEHFEPQGDRGDVFDSNGHGRHGTAPKETLQAYRSRMLMQALARHLTECHGARAFARLVITAPPKLLGELRQQLPDAVRACVAAELPKNLGHESADTLAGLMQDALVGSGAR